jgi:carbamoyl-phosphate synthase large subunit
VTLNVLISSAGRRVALLNAFRSALGGDGRVLAADCSPYAAAGLAADGRYVVPPCTHEDFVPAMLELCAREQIGLVIPTIDPELPVWAAHREEFRAAGTLVAVSSSRAIALGADKRETHRFLTAAGLPTVEQAELSAVLADRRHWPYPFVVKPVNGSASDGVVVVRDRASLRSATTDGDVVVQRLAAGLEYTVDVFADEHGVCLGAVPRQRLEVRAGEVSKARTARITPVMDLCEQVVKSLPDAFGVLNVQLFFEAATGRAQIIEINPRFAGGYPLADRAGAPFIRWLLALAREEPRTGDGDSWRSGMVMLRYDESVFAHETELESD